MFAIPSFPLPFDEDNLVAKPQSQQIEIVPISEQIRLLAEQVDKEQRKLILAQVFSDDLKLLVTQETDNAQKLGLAKGLEEAAGQNELSLERLKADLEQQKAQLAEIISNFKPTELQLPTDVIQSMVNWQAEAVFRVLGHEAKDKQFLLDNLNQVVADTAMLQGVELHCHPQDISHLIEPTKAHSHIKKVTANATFQLGEIRMVCGDSQIRMSLAARLQQLSSQLLELAEYHND